MDYSKITLIFRERAKLFTMRFIHPVSAKFIGQDCYNLSHVYKFIYSPYEFTDTLKNEHRNLVSITLLTITGVTVHGNGNNFTILRSGNYLFLLSLLLSLL